MYVWGNNDEGQLCDLWPEGDKGNHGQRNKLEKPEEVKLMFGQREYEAVSVSAGPAFNLIIGRINLKYEKERHNHGSRKKNQQKFQFKEPLIMPDDEKRYKDCPP